MRHFHHLQAVPHYVGCTVLCWTPITVLLVINGSPETKTEPGRNPVCDTPFPGVFHVSDHENRQAI